METDLNKKKTLAQTFEIWQKLNKTFLSAAAE